MRIAIISPYSVGPMRGNITTVRRIRRNLEKLGIEAIELPADTMTAAKMAQQLASFRPVAIHGFHARYCGDTARYLASRLDIPYLITITGSDINDPALRDHPDTARALASATAIACFDTPEAAVVTEYFPEAEKRTVLVPQGVEPLPVTGEPVIVFPDRALMLLLPAALRQVKNVEFPIMALRPIQDDHPNLALALAGGVIDQRYANSVLNLLGDAPFAKWLGEVPYERMGDLYAQADIVLNCSQFEGMPNCLLEAMALGRPVLAVDIPGNRSLVRDGETGLLFRDELEFRRQLLRLTADRNLRATCGRNGREFVLSHFSPAREAEGYLGIYQRMIHGTT